MNLRITQFRRYSNPGEVGVNRRIALFWRFMAGFSERRDSSFGGVPAASNEIATGVVIAAVRPSGRCGSQIGRLPAQKKCLAVQRREAVLIGRLEKDGKFRRAEEISRPGTDTPAENRYRTEVAAGAVAWLAGSLAPRTCAISSPFSKSMIIGCALSFSAIAIPEMRQPTGSRTTAQTTW